MSHSRKKCMNCDNSPTVDVLWAEGMGRAWFCAKCYAAWKKKHPGEVVSEHRINGEAPPKFRSRKTK